MSTNSMAILNWTATILNKCAVTTDIIKLQLSKPLEFDFVAGQFVQLHIPDTNKNVSRSYSIASTPCQPVLEFYIRLLEQGLASNYMRKIMIGDTIPCSGPYGKFVLTKKCEKVCFIAAGVAITPCYSIICDETFNKKHQLDMSLYFGVRSQESLILAEELTRIKKNNPNFKFLISLSRPREGWDGATGRITEHLDTVDTNSHFFICGRGDMLKDVQRILFQKGVRESLIHYEVY